MPGRDVAEGFVPYHVFHYLAPFFGTGFDKFVQNGVEFFFGKGPAFQKDFRHGQDFLPGEASAFLLHQTVSFRLPVVADVRCPFVPVACQVAPDVIDIPLDGFLRDSVFSGQHFLGNQFAPG